MLAVHKRPEQRRGHGCSTWRPQGVCRMHARLCHEAACRSTMPSQAHMGGPKGRPWEQGMPNLAGYRPATKIALNSSVSYIISIPFRFYLQGKDGAEVQCRVLVASVREDTLLRCRQCILPTQKGVGSLFCCPVVAVQECGTL